MYNINCITLLRKTQLSCCMPHFCYIADYKKSTIKLINFLRSRVIEESGKRVSDRELSVLIGITPSEFSRVSTGVSCLSSVRFYRLILLVAKYGGNIDSFLPTQESVTVGRLFD